MSKACYAETRKAGDRIFMCQDIRALELERVDDILLQRRIVLAHAEKVISAFSQNKALAIHFEDMTCRRRNDGPNAQE